MKINEIFQSIQGEGAYAGESALFIRLSGCNRNCDFCDTKYHKKGKDMSMLEIIERINKSNSNIVVYTGGEAMKQFDETNDIYTILYDTNKQHNLETNGDFLVPLLDAFDYICFSPKDEDTAEKIWMFIREHEWSNDKFDIKIVTDLDMNRDLIPYATMLMPLTTSDDDKNVAIKKDVWNYCVEHNIHFCLRQHIEVWGRNKRGV